MKIYRPKHLQKLSIMIEARIAKKVAKKSKLFKFFR